MSIASASASTSPVGEQQPTTGPIALAGAPRPAGAPKPKPRKRVNTAEKRHQHNAIERQRRETLNGKFLVLARLLPSLAACRRPSKSAIVNGSISHLSHQRQQRLLASKLLRQLAAERDELIAEVNQWRQANGCQPKPMGHWTEEMEEVCQVEQEKFGSFANVDENVDEQEDDETGHGFDTMNLETANLVAGSFSTGLVTPRSSTDMGATPPVAVNGFNWTGNSYAVTSAPSLPFNAFMSDSAEASSLPSPVGSAHSGAMLTPKSAVDPTTLYTRTPSPRGSATPEETGSPANQWSPQHLAMLQHVQHQNLQRHQQHSAFAAALSAQPQPGNLLLQQQMQHSQQGPGFAQLMASMFPQQREVGSEEWSKMTLNGSMMGSSHQQANAAPGFGFNGLNNGWSEQAVGV